ncbi:MAG TPA: hypothetical protein VND87_12180 [Stellaceae bacterium]|nr:hypothetical protein [Stellaceae bacterium]
MYSDYPDSPEAVALGLLDRVLERGEPQQRSNRPTERRIIDLYVQCLAAVKHEPGAADPAWR